ncbi:PEP-CTERM/exosortase system-associated acyltransferase [Halomonas alimentaria]|uniref:PEP-CTERM/exosortase system-associated acyltransferase n=1 Tax=Halomonas alimentaria TaxID=147248 RepID=UPI00248FCD1C|nr:PEP-CTERM/exosortase system-associated acyltransferase [Halomonas alimentaria]
MSLGYTRKHSGEAIGLESLNVNSDSLGSLPDGGELFLTGQFAKAFHFQVAFEETDRRRAYRLRKSVFIDELGYHMTTKEGGTLESDEYDDVAAQCVLVHKASGVTAGCFRIVTPYSVEQDSPRQLPVEKHGSHGISHDTLHPRVMPRDKICEASRLAIAQEFRHHRDNERVENASLDPTFRLILPGLFLAAYSLAELLGNSHLYAMMAPTLPRLLRKSGFNFVRLGDTIEFHGRRNVFYINRDLAGSGLQDTLAPLHRHIYEELAPQAKRYLAIHHRDPA